MDAVDKAKDVEGVVKKEGLGMVEGVVKKEGLGMLIATIFLSGEMAGSGVLALAAAMIGTGPGGLSLIIIFSGVAAFIGTRLGFCWIMIEERYAEYRDQCRDPYPIIAEKAFGKVGRWIVIFCLTVNQYGTCCVYIVVMANYFTDLFCQLNVELSTCVWMVIVTAGITPLTWLGTPNDFWPVAVGALLTTVAGCLMIMVQESLDVKGFGCHSPCINQTNGTSQDQFEESGLTILSLLGEHDESCNGTKIHFEPNFPDPEPWAAMAAFGTVMFAFAGASSFPTIQADMKDRTQFPKAAITGISILFLIYFPMAAVGYLTLGDKVSANIPQSLCAGIVKNIVMILLLIHLIFAFPIMINPTNQYYENVLKIPKHFNWKRALFRTVMVGLCLFVGETIPSFGAILNLVGGSTITCCTFIFPPFFWMRLSDASSQNKQWIQRKIPVWQRVISWAIIMVGIAGGICATISSILAIGEAKFGYPCYVPGSISNVPCYIPDVSE